MATLSDPQARIYEFIEEYTRREGCPPTNREIGMAVGILSTGHVDYHLTMLEKKGFIQRERKKSRGIRMTHPATRGLRIEGTIAAGLPLDIYGPDQQNELDLTVHTREYVLLVRGDSMIEDHIADGDFVLVDRDAYIDNGDIIVAIRRMGSAVETGAATLKRLYREPGRVRLQPANATMEPLYVDAREWDDEWEIQGKVTAVYRRC